MRHLILILSLFLVAQSPVIQAQSKKTKASTYIDSKGVIRWTETKKEVSGLGVNYSSPFSYLTARLPIGEDPYKAIDEDVYHISRLGLDAYRIHVWESFISDSLGNIVDTENLKQYDYLQYKLKERGIKLFITPVNFYGDGGEGFVNKNGGKMNFLSTESLFPIMANYLQQFLNHVNPYTGIAYKDDPDIIGFEIANEPQHWKAPELIKPFINMMYDAMRETGCEKPILYNMSTCASFIDKVLETKVQGGCLQWYPTGLTSNFDVKGNYLPFVDKYELPFAEELRKRNMPKVIYEFSPADVSQSGALYPAMARSFKEAGFQFVAKFAYDPLHAAYCNVEYKTHFLNMVYTPEKSMGMMIAAEAFREMPLYKSYGRYPENNVFGSTTLDPRTQRAEFNSNEVFLYSSSTSSEPRNISKLKKVAGIGNSSIVKYDGTGIYILDKLEDGVWRLEVMPDAFFVRDPFFVPSVNREVAVAISRNQKMKIDLKELGVDFNIKGLNEGNHMTGVATDNTIQVAPGAYLLTKKGVVTNLNSSSSHNNLSLGEYHAPKRKMLENYVLNDTPKELIAGDSLSVKIKVLTEKKPRNVQLYIVSQSGGVDKVKMQSNGEYDYCATLPSKYTKLSQFVNYHIAVETENGHLMFPDSKKGELPNPLSFYDNDTKLDEGTYTLNVLSEDAPIYLFSSNYDFEEVIKLHRNDKLTFIPGEYFRDKTMLLNSASRFGDNVVSSWCRSRIEDRQEDIDSKNHIEIKAKATNVDKSEVKLTLILRDGSSYASKVNIDNRGVVHKINVSDFGKDYMVLHPLAYPQFRTHNYTMPNMSELDLKEIEKIQIQILPKASHANTANEKDQLYGIKREEFKAGNSNEQIAIDYIRLM